MRILVTFALENEFAPWRELREFRPVMWGDTDGLLAEIDGAQVGVLLTGVGPKPARKKISRVLRGEWDSVTCCISSGLAGGLRAGYEIGNVLVARSVVSECAQSADENNFVNGSEALISLATEYGATVVDRFYTAGRVIMKAEDKKRLGAVADAVEMERFEVLREAQNCGIPAVAVRAISDTAAQDLPLDMNDIFTPEGQVSMPRVFAQVTRHPQAMRELMRLAQDSKRAATALGQFLDRYVTRLVESTRILESRAASAKR